MNAFGVLPSWVKVMNAGGKLAGWLIAPMMRWVAAHAATDPRTDRAIHSGRERAAVPTLKALRDVDADVRLLAMQVLHDLGTATSARNLPGEPFTEFDPDPTVRSSASWTSSRPWRDPTLVRPVDDTRRDPCSRSACERRPSHRSPGRRLAPTARGGPWTSARHASRDGRRRQSA